MGTPAVSAQQVADRKTCRANRGRGELRNGKHGWQSASADKLHA